MQQTKYFIEGQTAAHAGAVRACRYKITANILEWFAGWDSVDRGYVVFKILPGYAGSVEGLDPVYVGSAKQCQDRAVTLQQADRAGRFVVYSASTGKPYQEETKLNFKNI